MPDPSFQKKRDFAHASATPDHSNRYAVRCRKTRNIKSNRENKVRKDRRDDSGPRLPSARCFFTRQDRFFISGADTNRRLYDYGLLILSRTFLFATHLSPGPFPQPVRSLPRRHAPQKSGQGRTRIAGPLPNRPVPQLPRPSPENKAHTETAPPRRRSGAVPVPAAENRARSSVRRPTALFLPVETIRYRTAGSERPQEAAVPIARRTPPGETNAAAFRPAGSLPNRNGSDEMPLRPPRNGDRRFETRVSRKQIERKRPHSAECGRFSLRRSVRIGRSSRSDQSNAAIFSSNTLSGHTPT